MMFLFNDILIVAKSKWNDNNTSEESIGQKIVTNLRTRAKTMLKMDMKPDTATENDGHDSPSEEPESEQRDSFRTQPNKKYKFERLLFLSQCKVVDIKQKLDESISAAPGKCFAELLITPSGESTETLILVFKDVATKELWVNAVREEIVNQKKRSGHFSASFVEIVKEHERGKLDRELGGSTTVDSPRNSIYLPPPSPKKNILSSSPPS